MDLADFNLWLTSASSDWAGGDFNGDGSVDLADYNLWLTGTPPGDSPPQSTAASQLAADTVASVAAAAMPVAAAEASGGKAEMAPPPTVGSAAKARSGRRLNHRRHAGPNARSPGVVGPIVLDRFGGLNAITSMARLGFGSPASALVPIVIEEPLDLGSEMDADRTR